MKFSVLMSVYCKENPDFLDSALRSNLEEQIVKPDEFVLVCDGKLTKELDRVIEKYQSDYPDVFCVYRLDKNMGLGAALNFGLEKCSNELIARADSDDICVPDRFKIEKKFMEEHPDISAVGSAIDEFDDDCTNPVHVKYMPEGEENVCSRIRSRNPINHMTVMFRKKDVLAVGSYIHLPYLEDYYLWARLLGEGYKIDNINQILVHARVGNGMVKRRGNKEQIKSRRILDEYMLGKNLITHGRKTMNGMLIRAFVTMPDGFREWAYKRILRRN